MSSSYCNCAHAHNNVLTKLTIMILVYISIQQGGQIGGIESQRRFNRKLVLHPLIAYFSGRIPDP